MDHADADKYSYLIKMMPFDVEAKKSLSHEDAAERVQKHKVGISFGSWYTLSGSTHRSEETLVRSPWPRQNQCFQFFRRKSHVEQLIGYQLLNARQRDATISCKAIGLKMSS